jgi:Insertion element 4 transposase N-terminal
LDVDDKVCDQVDLTLLAQVYPSEAIQRCVGQSQPWATKARRVRQSTLLALVLFVIGMALWSRLNQRLVWDKLVGKLSALHPGEPQSQLSASALSGRRQELGSQGLQALLHECCRVLAQPQTMRSRVLWSLSAHGHRWDGLQHRRDTGQ